MTGIGEDQSSVMKTASGVANMSGETSSEISLIEVSPLWVQAGTVMESGKPFKEDSG
jgi:hypothetical protein